MMFLPRRAGKWAGSGRSLGLVTSLARPPHALAPRGADRARLHRTDVRRRRDFDAADGGGASSTPFDAVLRGDRLLGGGDGARLHVPCAYPRLPGEAPRRASLSHSRRNRASPRGLARSLGGPSGSTSTPDDALGRWREAGSVAVLLPGAFLTGRCARTKAPDVGRPCARRACRSPFATDCNPRAPPPLFSLTLFRAQQWPARSSASRRRRTLAGGATPPQRPHSALGLRRPRVGTIAPNGWGATSLSGTVGRAGPELAYFASATYALFD